MIATVEPVRIPFANDLSIDWSTRLMSLACVANRRVMGCGRDGSRMTTAVTAELIAAYVLSGAFVAVTMHVPDWEARRVLPAIEQPLAVPFVTE